MFYLSNLSAYFSTCFKVQWTRKLIFYVFFLFVIWFLGWFVSWKIILLPKCSWFVKIFWDELSPWSFDVIEFVNLPIVQIVYSYYYYAAYFIDRDCVIWKKRHKNDEIGYCVLGSVINHIFIAIFTILYRFLWKFNIVSCRYFPVHYFMRKWKKKGDIFKINFDTDQCCKK